MYKREQIRDELKKQLAIELNCEPEDFSKKENIITIAKDRGEDGVTPNRYLFFQWLHWGKMLSSPQTQA